VDGIYFTTTTLSSVGYGDILPTTTIGKMVISAQQLIVLFLSWGMLSTINCE
jgi:hypothetical protein